MVLESFSHLKNKEVHVINIEFLCNYFKYKKEDLPSIIEVSHTEWAWRFLLDKMLKSYGYSFNNRLYKIALNKVKIKNRSKINS